MPIFRGKQFVGSASDYKDSVRVATRSNIPLADLVYSIDGVSLKHQDRVLLAGQTNASQNGIYVWSSFTAKLVRSTDADSNAEVSSGMDVYVEEGEVNSRTKWKLITPSDIVLGTTLLTFVRENKIGTYDFSGTYGGPCQTVSITIDESGQITAIEAHDINGGFF